LPFKINNTWPNNMIPHALSPLQSGSSRDFSALGLICNLLSSSIVFWLNLTPIYLKTFFFHKFWNLTKACDEYLHAHYQLVWHFYLFFTLFPSLLPPSIPTDRKFPKNHTNKKNKKSPPTLHQPTHPRFTHLP
jgi:hypothetical protein